MEYVIAVVALLVAVWALLYAREVERATFSDQREYAETLWTVIAELRGQVAEIKKIVNGSGLTLEQLGEVREQIRDLEAVAKYIGDCIGEDIFPDDLPPGSSPSTSEGGISERS